MPESTEALTAVPSVHNGLPATPADVVAQPPKGGSQRPARRPHIYELDPMRIVTALTVVAVHVLGFTIAAEATGLAQHMHIALIIAVHFTRAVFMFVTAFTAVYVYFGKPFSPMNFWKKRFVGVFVPYCIWSAIYVWVNTPAHTLKPFVLTTFWDVLTGNASYQLYYVLLTLQFYIAVPLFFLFLKWLRRFPWQTLAISFTLQVIWFYIDYHTVQRGMFSTSLFWQLVNRYQDRFLLTYQFYFVLGGFVALYLSQVHAFLARYGWMTLVCCFVALAALWIHFALQVYVEHEGINYVQSVLQPAMVFYSLAVIACMYWVAFRWAQRVDQAGHPRGYRFWSTLSDAAFGIYLVHALILDALLKDLGPQLPAVWPAALRIFLIWLLTASSATAITVILLQIPVVSRLVGRSRPLPERIKQRITTIQWW